MSTLLFNFPNKMMTNELFRCQKTIPAWKYVDWVLLKSYIIRFMLPGRSLRFASYFLFYVFCAKYFSIYIHYFDSIKYYPVASAAYRWCFGIIQRQWSCSFQCVCMLHPLHRFSLSAFSVSIGLPPVTHITAVNL